MIEEMKAKLMEWMAAAVDAAETAQDPATGRFLAPNGGWAITLQDVILVLGTLYVTPHEKNPWHGDERVLRLCARGGNALVDAQDENGTFEFIKTDGSRWGRTYMPWTFYHWLEAHALLKDALPADVEARWRGGLELGYNGLCREMRETTAVHNIPTWKAMSLVRAGRLFGRDDWADAGREGIYRAVREQSPDGFWFEGGGPTTRYNSVYVHAIGLYYHFTGDKAVEDALKRATDFHVSFTYPDGVPVETVDGRVLYSDGANVTGLPGFLPFPQGRALTNLIVGSAYDRFRGQGRGDEKPGTPPSAHVASAYRVLDGLREAECAPIPQSAPKHRGIYRGRAAIVKDGPFFACLSGYLTRLVDYGWQLESRWIKDRQNYVSLWHERLGLLIGGGNSKYTPKFSTFNVVRGRRHTLVADESTVAFDGEAARLDMDYDGVRCVCSLDVLGADAVRFRFSAEDRRPTEGEDVTVTGRLLLRLFRGEKLTHQGHTSEIDPKATLAWKLGPDAPLSSGRGWVLECPGSATIEWPEYPFNPYAIDNTAPEDCAMSVVAMTLLPDRPAAEIVLRIV